MGRSTIDWSAMAVQAKTDRDVRQWFIVANEPLCKHFANRFRATLDLDDAMQAARMGINRAVELYDPDKGAWGTYAVHWVHAEVSRARAQVPSLSGFRHALRHGKDMTEEQLQAYYPLSTNVEIPGSDTGEEWGTLLQADGPIPDEVMGAQERDDEWSRTIAAASLTAKERLVVSRLLRGSRQSDVARGLGVTRQRVEQIQRKAEKKLRQAAARRSLCQTTANTR